MYLTKNNTHLNFILGTAAELIKMYPLIRLGLDGGLNIKIFSTGQARENFIMQYRDFRLPEEILIHLIESHGDLDRASSAIKWFFRATLIRTPKLRSALSHDGRSLILVHGDTLSTLVGALIGYRLKIPVAHIEAGLRSPRLLQPFPEEITRRVVSRLTQLHFAPTAEAAQNLHTAGVVGKIVNTHGNTLKDAVLMAQPSQNKNTAVPYALANLHRFENLNSQQRWQTLVRTTLTAARKLKVIFVLHPQTRHRLESDSQTLKAFADAGVELHDRLAFSHFLGLLKNAEFLISDGGSNQEECSYLGKPCLLLREETERNEGLGGNCLLSRFDDRLIDRFLNDWEEFRQSPEYSDTSPSSLILKTIMQE